MAEDERRTGSATVKTTEAPKSGEAAKQAQTTKEQQEAAKKAEAEKDPADNPPSPTQEELDDVKNRALSGNQSKTYETR